MPYVIRDASGRIIRATVRAIQGAENLPYEHPDLLAFLRNNGQDPTKIDDALAELRRTDSDMSRAIEDVVMVLLKKGLLKLTELPKPVQEKMGYRVKLRMTVQDILDQASGQNSATNFANQPVPPNSLWGDKF